jgi:hypothetical protein
LSYQHFKQFLLNLGPRLPPGGRNWQLMGAALIRLTEQIFYENNNVILITFYSFNHPVLLKNMLLFNETKVFVLN